MARNEALEAWLDEELGAADDAKQKAMFGGLAWLVNGHLTCAARHDGMLARVGAERNEWALAKPGVAPMIMRGKALEGWVRALPEATNETRRQLIQAALAFARTLPATAKGAAKAAKAVKAKPRRPARR
ncbi:MAG: cold-shock protein [Bradyrhizobium sp.]|nr:MAG: cold-shock protein [Bradyrhizobium sp.]